MGGGTPRTSTAARATPRSPAPRPNRPRLSPFRHSCAPPSVIPTQAGTRATSPPSFLRRQEPPNKPPLLPNSSPTYDEKGAQLPNSSLPPLRGEVRWGVERHEPAPPIAPRPDRPLLRPNRPRLSPFRHSCAPPPATPAPLLPSFLRRQEPPNKPPLLPNSSPHTTKRARSSPIHPPHTTKRARRSPIHPSPLSGGRLGGGWNATSQHRRPRATPQSPAPLTLPPLLRPSSVIPAPLLRRSCLRRNDERRRGRPERTPNKPEHPRTNPNKPEHAKHLRPDRTTPKSTPNRPEKKQP